MTSIRYILPLLVISLLFSCKKEEEAKKMDTFKNGLLVINEGLFHQNNSSLSWVNLETNEVTNNVFEQVNNRLLGDTGNDMLVYGDKLYITVTTSSTVEILNKNTLKSIKQIPFDYNGVAQQPRYLASYKGKVYVSSFDGYVSAIDTTSLKVTKRIKVGRNPDGISIFNDALFVSNSGGLDFNNMDSTVMRIDLLEEKVTDTLIVGTNPGKIISDNNGRVYVVKRGDYSTDPSELIVIDANNLIINNTGINTTTLSKRGDLLYLGYFDYTNGLSLVKTFNIQTQSLENEELISSTDFTTLHNVLPFKEDQVVGIDAMNYTNSGYLRFYNLSGTPIKEIQVGLNPRTFIHFN